MERHESLMDSSEASRGSEMDFERGIILELNKTDDTSKIIRVAVSVDGGFTYVYYLIYLSKSQLQQQYIVFKIQKIGNKKIIIL